MPNRARLRQRPGRGARRCASARHGGGTAQGGQSGCGHAGRLHRTDHRCRRAGCSGPEPPLDRDLSTPVASWTGVGVEGRWPATGGRQARRDTRRLRAGLCRADVSQSRQLHDVASVRELRGAFPLSSSQSLPRGPISAGPCLVLQSIRFVEYEGVDDEVVRSALYWAGGSVRELVPPRRPFAPSQRQCRPTARTLHPSTSPLCGIWQRIGGPNGAARCTGARRHPICRRPSTRCGSSTWGRNRPIS